MASIAVVIKKRRRIKYHEMMKFLKQNKTCFLTLLSKNADDDDNDDNNDNDNDNDNDNNNNNNGLSNRSTGWP